MISEGKSPEASWNHINFDEIEVGARIGGGGVGVIYTGWYKNKQVALKTLFDPRVSEDLKREYMDELLVMSRVKHSNIVSFLGACMTPPNLFFVMEICRCSLFDLLHKDRERFSEKELLRMMIDLASAMEYLHAQRPAIIHRDLKSHNVLQAFDGSLKICDFGLVKIRNSQAGTPAYMAPELFDNKPFNKSVDVYSFGILMWEMMTGSIPYYMIDVNDIRRRVVARERPAVPAGGCGARAKRLMTDCWSHLSENRPDFTAIVDELLECFDQLPDNTFTDSVGLGDGGDALDGLLSFK